MKILKQVAIFNNYNDIAFNLNYILLKISQHVAKIKSNSFANLIYLRKFSYFIPNFK